MFSFHGKQFQSIFLSEMANQSTITMPIAVFHIYIKVFRDKMNSHTKISFFGIYFA